MAIFGIQSPQGGEGIKMTVEKLPRFRKKPSADNKNRQNTITQLKYLLYNNEGGTICFNCEKIIRNRIKYLQDLIDASS